MNQSNILFVGMDVHKESIEIALAEDEEDGEIRRYGKIGGTFNAMNNALYSGHNTYIQVIMLASCSGKSSIKLSRRDMARMARVGDTWNPSSHHAKRESSAESFFHGLDLSTLYCVPGCKYEKGAFPWGASGCSLPIGCDEGMTKVLFDEHHRIIGAGIVGTNAGELIAEAVLALEMGADV